MEGQGQAPGYGEAPEEMVGVWCRFQTDENSIGTSDSAYLLIPSTSTVEEVMRFFLKQNNIFLDQSSLEAFIHTHALWLHPSRPDVQGSWLNHPRRLSSYYIEPQDVLEFRESPRQRKEVMMAHQIKIIWPLWLVKMQATRFSFGAPSKSADDDKEENRMTVGEFMRFLCFGETTLIKGKDEEGQEVLFATQAEETLEEPSALFYGHSLPSSLLEENGDEQYLPLLGTEPLSDFLSRSLEKDHCNLALEVAWSKIQLTAVSEATGGKGVAMARILLWRERLFKTLLFSRNTLVGDVLDLLSSVLDRDTTNHELYLMSSGSGLQPSVFLPELSLASTFQPAFDGSPLSSPRTLQPEHGKCLPHSLRISRIWVTNAVLVYRERNKQEKGDTVDLVPAVDPPLVMDVSLPHPFPSSLRDESVPDCDGSAGCDSKALDYAHCVVLYPKDHSYRGFRVAMESTVSSLRDKAVQAFRHSVSSLKKTKSATVKASKYGLFFPSPRISLNRHKQDSFQWTAGVWLEADRSLLSYKRELVLDGHPWPLFILRRLPGRKTMMLLDGIDAVMEAFPTESCFPVSGSPELSLRCMLTLHPKITVKQAIRLLLQKFHLVELPGLVPSWLHLPNVLGRSREVIQPGALRDEFPQKEHIERDEESQFNLCLQRTTGRSESSSVWLDSDVTLLSSWAPRWKNTLELRKQGNAHLSAALMEFSLPFQPTLLPGELILDTEENVTHFVSQVGRTVGRLILTNYQLAFISYDKSSYEELASKSLDTYMPLCSVNKLRATQQSVQILCKDLRNVLFKFKPSFSTKRASVSSVPPGSVHHDRDGRASHNQEPTTTALRESRRRATPPSADAAGTSPSSESGLDLNLKKRMANISRSFTSPRRAYPASTGVAPTAVDKRELHEEKEPTLASTSAPVVSTGSSFIDKLWQAIAFDDVEETFAFTNREQNDTLSDGCEDGARTRTASPYQPMQEYKRIGLIPSTHWRVTDVNADYQLCSTYPSIFVVPAAVSDEELQEITSFRARGRIPATVWKHPTNGATITRCGQPHVGNALVNNISNIMTIRRCTEDEKLIQTIRMSTRSQELYLIDSRPQVNAVANSFKKGGSEDVNVYKGCKHVFMGIGNIKVMSESFKKLIEVCQPTKSNPSAGAPSPEPFYSSLEASRWLEHISVILSSAVTIATLVHCRGISCVTHCTDGWDRTSQLSALAQLLLDPYFRTIIGFQVLIEKEWITFGHQFKTRCGHLGGGLESPIFLMFIECVWQVMEQYPCSFEFNEAFLITILDHSYSCRFGTFLCDNEKERHACSVDSRTPSLWDFLNKNHAEYRNPFFRVDGRLPKAEPERVLFPVASQKKLRFWTNYYMRWVPEMRPQESREAQMQQALLEVRRLREKIERKKKRKHPKVGQHM